MKVYSIPNFGEYDVRGAFIATYTNLIAYIGWLFEYGRVCPTSVAHYVSADNTSLRSMGIVRPCELFKSAAERVLIALKGDQKKWV